MKQARITLRVTDEDRKLFEERAKMMRMSISDYVRYCCLTKPPKEVIENEQKRG